MSGAVLQNPHTPSFSVDKDHMVPQLGCSGEHISVYSLGSCGMPLGASSLDRLLTWVYSKSKIVLLGMYLSITLRGYVQCWGAIPYLVVNEFRKGSPFLRFGNEGL